jgi:putative membrane protein
MREFIIRILINAIGVAVAAAVLDGITVKDSVTGLLTVGFILTLLNTLLKPLLKLLSCPFVLLTLGLFVLVINAAILGLAAQFSGDTLNVDGFWWAVAGGVVMAIVNMVLEGALIQNAKKKR